MNSTQKKKISTFAIKQLKQSINFKLTKDSEDFDSIMQSIITTLNKEYRNEK